VVTAHVRIGSDDATQYDVDCSIEGAADFSCGTLRLKRAGLS